MDKQVLEMLDEFSDIASNEKSISANSVLEILKNYSSTISVFDMMAVSAEIMEENKYVQANYREERFWQMQTIMLKISIRMISSMQ